MDDDKHRVVEFEKLNLLGKAIYLGGATVRFTAGIIDKAIDRTTEIITEAEAAFLREIDPNVEDAKIIDEVDDRPAKHKRS